MVTKNERGREENSNSALVWHCGDQGFFAILTCRFSVNNLFPFPLATALLKGLSHEIDFDNIAKN